MSVEAREVESLDDRQRALLAVWLPGAFVVRDLSWGLLETTVLEVTVRDVGRFIVKAGGPSDKHLAREIHAHQQWLIPWVSQGRAPQMMHHDVDAKVLLTCYLPGDLVLGTEHERAPETFRQAGELLAAFHRQLAVVDDGWEAAENARSFARLGAPHRIDPETTTRLRELVGSFATPPVTLVPTHGDWQPRNWLIHQGTVSVIDFGRAALRPAWTDMTRLAVKDFPGNPDLEGAFLAGYESDPREAGGWFRTQVREAIGTAVWGHQVGDEEFERLGHRMVADVLARADLR